MKQKFTAALRSATVGLALALGAGLLAPTAHAQRGGGGGGGNWEVLGEQQVGAGTDRDVIELGHNADHYRDRAYRQLRFIAQGGDVKLKSIRLVYQNGHREDLNIDRTLRPGQEFDVDLRGERKFLSRIEMVYQGKFGFSIGPGGIKIGQPTVTVLGENARGGGPGPDVRPAPIAKPRSNWPEIGSARFDRQDDRAEIDVGHREGRVSQIRLHLEGEPITIRELRIRFRNGESQVVRLDQQLLPGEETRGIDLDGDKRRIVSVILILDPRRRPGRANVTLLGKEDVAREERVVSDYGYRKSWVPLGEQTVGFGVDRDVIRLGQNEGFYRNRVFDKLHFIAERADIHMLAVRLVYMNGFAEDYRVDRLIRDGADLALDLPGSRGYLKEIGMTYRSKPGFDGKAIMKVYGEQGGTRRRDD